MVLDELRDWYCAQCDGDWEHTYGVVIETLDNPGWKVKIDLRDTILEDAPFPAIISGNSEEHEFWIDCRVDAKQFHGAGDTSRLEEIISHFIRWAKDRPDWLAVPDDSSVAQRNDCELWEHLGKNLGEEGCRVEGCGHWRTRHSVFGRVHHWEKVFGRPCPFTDSKP
jgi:Immunity protein 53